MALAQGRARFDQLVVDATKHREEFERLFRESCIHLGSYCAAVDEAQSLQNEIAPLIPVERDMQVRRSSPEDRDKIAELTRPLNPLAELMDKGYAGTTSFGWNMHISAIPVRSKNGENN